MKWHSSARQLGNIKKNPSNLSLCAHTQYVASNLPCIMPPHVCVCVIFVLYMPLCVRRLVVHKCDNCWQLLLLYSYFYMYSYVLMSPLPVSAAVDFHCRHSELVHKICKSFIAVVEIYATNFSFVLQLLC